MKNSIKNEKEISEGSYFVVDNSSSYSVIYTDTGINARVQFVWKDELALKDNEFDDEKEDEEIICD